MKKTISAILLSGLLVMGMSSCHTASKIGRINTNESNPENIDQKMTDSSADPELLNGEYDPTTHMRYALNDDGKSYSACPTGLPDVVKEFVIPGEYHGLPVTKIRGKCLADSSIETIRISEGIQEISVLFDYCTGIKNIDIPASMVYIGGNIFQSRPTMGYPSFARANVIEKIVVAEGNPYYYVEGNCLIDRRSEKIILGCSNSVLPDDGSVKRIGDDAFANCKSIETVILPKSIIEIENYAFVNCPNLKQVYITSSVSEDKKMINFDTEFTFEDGRQHIFYVPDTESLEIYSRIFESYHAKFEIGTP